MPHVHVVGYLSIDCIATPEQRHERVPGGAALYAALGARAAGAAVVLHAAAGDDFDQGWLDALARLGVDVAAVARQPGATRRARLVHDADGQRTSTHDAQSWWERTAALAPPLPARLAADDVLALAPVPATIAAAAIAGAGGARVIADTSEAFAARDRDALLALLQHLTVFAPSREETRLLHPGLGDDEAALALAARGCMIMQKRGSEGAAIVAGAGAALEALPAPAAQVVDPTGAGDATVGALAARLAVGQAFAPAARRALQVGALTVGGVGPSALGLEFTREHAG